MCFGELIVLELKNFYDGFLLDIYGIYDYVICSYI